LHQTSSLRGSERKKSEEYFKNNNASYVSGVRKKKNGGKTYIDIFSTNTYVQPDQWKALTETFQNLHG